MKVMIFLRVAMDIGRVGWKIFRGYQVCLYSFCFTYWRIHSRAVG